MRILLTGASGFVGRSVIKLISGQHEIVCLGRKKPPLSKYITFLPVDLTDQASVETIAKSIDGNFDAIIHLAAHVPKERAEDTLRDASNVNIEGTLNLLEAFNGRFKKLIIGSTAEVYDQARIEAQITEDSPVKAGSYYGATKLASELIAQTFGSKNNIPVLILRFSVMYGPHDPISRALPNFIKKALKNETIEITGGQILRDYIYIDDVAESIRRSLMSEGISGVINVGTGSGISIEAAAKEVVRVSNSHSKLVMKSGSGGTDIILNPKKAKDTIGFEAKTFFPDNLDKMVDSYR